MRKAFTLIELLVVIAIIAILAAILFPVFAQAKAAAKVTTSLSGLKQIALGLQMYSTDYDDMTVYEYGYSDGSLSEDSNQYHYNNTWAGRIFPYVKNKSIYFDKTMGEPTNMDGRYQDPYYPDPWYTYTWAWITSFSLNTDGYSHTLTGYDCSGTINNTSETMRSLSSFESTANRLAVTPTRYGSIQNWSWTRFLAYAASWPTADQYADTFSWYQMVFDARKTYNNKFIGAYVDGHAAKYGPEKFVKYYANTPSKTEANSWGEYCSAMDNRKLWDFWGKYWSAN